MPAGSRATPKRQGLQPYGRTGLLQAPGNSGRSLLSTSRSSGYASLELLVSSTAVNVCLLHKMPVHMFCTCTVIHACTHATFLAPGHV